MRNTASIKKTLLRFVAAVCVAMALMAGIVTGQVRAGATSAGSKRTVRVSCGINKTLWLDDNGEPQGYCSDYINELASVNNWQLEYVNCSWNRGVQMLEDGELDLLLPTQMTEERQQTMLFSKLVCGYQQSALYVRADDDIFYDDYKSFDGKRVALTKGTSNDRALTRYAQENDFSYTPVYIDSSEEKLQALKNGEVDMVAFSVFNDSEGCKLVAIIDILPFYLAVNKNETELYDELNSGMQKILAERPSLVSDMYTNINGMNKMIALTSDESAFVNSAVKINIGFYYDTEPLSEVNSDGTYSGIYIDFLKLVKDISGLDIELYPIDRRQYGYQLLRDGTIDMLIGSSEMAIAAMNSDEFIASSSFLDYNTVAVTRQAYQFNDDAAPRFALISARQYWQDYINSNYEGAEITYYNTEKECLNALEDNKADAVLLNTLEYNYQSKNPRFQDLIEWESFRMPSHTVLAALSTVDPRLLSIINKAINQISDSDIENSVYYHLNVAYHSSDFKDYLYNARYTIGLVLFVVLLVSVVICVINRMHRRSMRALEKKNEQLRLAIESKTQFLSRMSHEIRTPINAISGLALCTVQDISDGRASAAGTVQNANEILESSKYLLAIVNDVLDTAKIEQGRIELAMSRWNVDEHLKHIYNMILPLADRKKVKLSMERRTNLNAAYSADGIRVQQILVNLLNNAIKFTPEGGNVKLTAREDAQPDGRVKLTFVVSDTGIGVSQDFIDNGMFHAFSQEDGGNTSPYSGSGLGLAISRELARLMGGDIVCRSEKNKGSVFTVTIIAQPVTEAQPKTDEGELSYDFGGAHILVCEDHPLNQKIIRRLLERANAQADIACDGAQGVDMFSRSGDGYYKVVLMDIRMPVMDGLEAARRLRAFKRQDAGRLKIIAMSANAFEDDRQKSIAAGMNEHLAKPVDAQILYAALASVLDMEGKHA